MLFWLWCAALGELITLQAFGERRFMLGAERLGTAALDIPTLFFVAVCLAALLGLFLIFAWLQERHTRALAWWGAAYLLGASSMTLWNAPQPLLSVPPDVAGAIMFIACGMIWNGVRLFHGRDPLLLASVAGAVAWLVCMRFPAIVGNDSARAMVGAIIIAVYTLSIALELWRERRKSLFSRTAAVIVPVMHCAIFLMPIVMELVWPASLGAGWLELLALETMIYAVGTAFIVLLMVKDQQVLFHRNEASIDPLTGLLNRRAFMDAAVNLCAQQEKKSGPVTLMMFDLDHFKSINDRFGHVVGDDALRVFAASVSSSLRVNDVIGRLGGEEFAAIVGTDSDVSARIAERVRAGFEAVGIEISGHEIGATVSIGTATVAADRHSVEWLIARADAALYAAKKAGRNRVHAAPPWTGGDRRLASAELARGDAAKAKPNLIPVTPGTPQSPSIH
jgi:diguanylate cyclase (GGDEF)-like protein